MNGICLGTGYYRLMVSMCVSNDQLVVWFFVVVDHLSFKLLLCTLVIIIIYDLLVVARKTFAFFAVFQMLVVCICGCLSFAWLSSAKRCFNQRGVDRRASRFIMSIHCFRTAVSDSIHLQRHWDRQSCPSFKLHTASLSSVQYNNRSLSPWRYR